MAPFAADQVRADMNALPDRDPSADPGAKDHAEHAVGSGPRAVGRLGEHEAVRVVHQTHRPLESLLERAPQRSSDQPRGVGVLHDPRALGDHARDANADGASLAHRALDERHQFANRLE